MKPATQRSQETVETQNPASSPMDDGSGNVDKIRDILFGGHMRDYETRFKRLEENLVRESAEIREMTQKRLEALEAFIKKEFAEQSAKLKDERDQRTADVKQQEKEVLELNQELSKRLTEANEQTAETARAIREELLSRSNELLQEMHSMHKQASDLLDRHVTDLKDTKTNRADLANLLREMAAQLTAESK